MNTYYATGRRKEAIARVWLVEGQKDLLINERPLENYFTREAHRVWVKDPLKKTNLGERFGLKVRVSGGGVSGQALAVRLGVARALLKVDESFRSGLRKEGYLTRDPRVKERKKYGRKGARRSFQYTKR